MKLQKSLTAKFAAAALSVGLSQATPVLAQDNPQSASATVEATENSQTVISAASSVEFNPLVPVEVLGGMGGIAALLLLLAARQRMRGAWARAAASTAFLVALSNPTINLDDRESLPTQVAIIVDQSASQTLDGRDLTTKEARAKLALELTGIENTEAITIEIGAPGNGKAPDGTDLTDAITQAVAAIPKEQFGGVIVITDGAVHKMPEELNTLLNGAPMHVLVTGRLDEFDRRIVLESAPAFGIIEETATIRFRVVDDGTAPNSSRVTVTLTADGTPIASQQVKPGDVTEMSVKIPHAGANILQLSTEVLPGEVTGVNNQIATSIEGVREKLKILLISGEPNAGERTWRNLLTSDPSVELVHFTILRPPGKEDEAPLNELSLISLPMRELFTQKLDDFDMVILDRYQYRGILPPPYLAKITEYVNEGGALLVTAGPDYAGAQSIYNTPLASILPAAPTGQVSQDGFRPLVSETGQRHPVTRNLSSANQNDPQWGRWFRVVDVQNTEGNVLMHAPGDKPLLILNEEAQGRVAMLLSDTSWLWARGYEGGGPYAELLQRTSHWLMKEPTLEEEALRASVENGQVIIERQTMASYTGPVSVQTPSGRSVSVTLQEEAPGLWRATLPADELGLYTVQQGNKRTFTSAGTASPRELSNTISTTETMAPYAQQTGGHVTRIGGDTPTSIILPKIELRSAGEAMHGDNWIGIHKTEASSLNDNQRMPLLTGFLGLSLLFGALAAAWHREGGGFSRGSRRKPDAAPKNEKPKGP